MGEWSLLVVHSILKQTADPSASPDFLLRVAPTVECVRLSHGESHAWPLLSVAK